MIYTFKDAKQIDEEGNVSVICVVTDISGNVTFSSEIIVPVKTEIDEAVKRAAIWVAAYPDEILKYGEHSVAEIKAGAKLSIVMFADDVTSKIKSRYPSGEVDGWPVKAAEAVKLLDTSELIPADFPLIRQICLSQYGDLDSAALSVEMRKKAADVVLRATQYTRIIGIIEGVRSAADLLIDAVDTLDAQTAREATHAILLDAKSKAQKALFAEGLT